MNDKTEKRTTLMLMGLTLMAALMAVGMSAQSMYGINRTELGMSTFVAGAFCAFLEVAQIAEAIRARTNYRHTGRTGMDGLAMWCLGGTNSFLCGWEEYTQGNTTAALVRVCAPIVAVLLWHRGVIQDQDVSVRSRYLRRVVDTAYQTHKSGFLSRRASRRAMERAILNAACAKALDAQGIDDVLNTLSLVGAQDSAGFKSTKVVEGSLAVAEGIEDTQGVCASDPVALPLALPAIEETTQAHKTSAVAPRVPRVRKNLADAQTMACALGEAFKDCVPNRKDAVVFFRGLYGSCSDVRADQARTILTAQRSMA